MQAIHEPDASVIIALIVTLPAFISAITLLAVRRGNKQIATPGRTSTGEHIETIASSVMDNGRQLHELRIGLNDHIDSTQASLAEQRARLSDLQGTLEEHVHHEEAVFGEQRARLGDIQEAVDLHVAQDTEFFNELYQALDIDKTVEPTKENPLE